MVVEVVQSSVVPLHILFTAHHPQAFSVCKQSEHLKYNHAILASKESTEVDNMSKNFTLH